MKTKNKQAGFIGLTALVATAALLISIFVGGVAMSDSKKAPKQPTEATGVLIGD